MFRVASIHKIKVKLLFRSLSFSLPLPLPISILASSVRSNWTGNCVCLALFRMFLRSECGIWRRLLLGLLQFTHVCDCVLDFTSSILSSFSIFFFSPYLSLFLTQKLSILSSRELSENCTQNLEHFSFILFFNI